MLEEGHYTIDEQARQAELNEAGHQYIEEKLTKLGLLAADESLYSSSNLSLLSHVNAGLRAHTLFNRNVEYIIQDGQVVLVDEHTGRTMPGRRLSEGLHQAIEAKEGVHIQPESQTMASTTFQNYFRLYDKLSGMTGTADTEAFEFRQIYGLDVTVIPTHRKVARIDHNDLVFLTQPENMWRLLQISVNAKSRADLCWWVLHRLIALSIFPQFCKLKALSIKCLTPNTTI